MEALEVKTAVDQIKNLVEHLKGENDSKFKQIEEKGAADIITLNNAQAMIKDLDVKLLNIEKALSRHGNTQSTKEDESLEVETKSFNLMRGSLLKKSAITNEEMKLYKSAFASYLRQDEKLVSPEDFKTLQIGHDPSGGYLVRNEWSNKIIGKSFEYSPLRQLATVETVSTDQLKFIVDWDEFDASFVAELAARATTTNTQFSENTINVHEIYAKPKVSQQMLEDGAIDVESYVMSKISDKLIRKEANKFINGTGVTEPKGILSYANGSTYGTVEQVASTSGAIIKWGDFLSLFSVLKDKYHGNATLLMRRQTFLAQVLTNLTSTGEYIVNIFEKDNIPMSIAGYPVKFDADMPAVAAGALAVAFGDFREAYTIVDRIGMSVLRDPYSAKPAVEFYARKRVGGGVVNSEAYKLMSITA